ncbi:hypothetical protein BDR26DRAFT_856466 [Obelidium mucronatum]|nr:hypothetical protein BDR26DRAFT_856466 [Obelidium mucronatum]
MAKCFTIQPTTTTFVDFVGYQLLTDAAAGISDTHSMDAFLEARFDTNPGYIAGFREFYDCPNWNGHNQRYHLTFYQSMLISAASNSPNNTCNPPTTSRLNPPTSICQSSCTKAIASLQAILNNPSFCNQTPTAAVLATRQASVASYQQICSALPVDTKACLTSVALERPCGFLNQEDTVAYCSGVAATAAGAGTGGVTGSAVSDSCCVGVNLLKPLNTTMIAGVAAAGAAVVCLLVVFACSRLGWCSRRQKQLPAYDDQQDDVEKLIPSKKKKKDSKSHGLVVKSGFLGGASLSTSSPSGSSPVSPQDVFRAANRKSRHDGAHVPIRETRLLSPTCPSESPPSLVTVVVSTSDMGIMSPTASARKEGGLPPPRRSESGRFQLPTDLTTNNNNNNTNNNTNNGQPKRSLDVPRNSRKYSVDNAPPRTSSSSDGPSVMLPSRRSEEGGSKMRATTASSALNPSGKPGPPMRRSVFIPPRQPRRLSRELAIPPPKDTATEPVAAVSISNQRGGSTNNASVTGSTESQALAPVVASSSESGTIIRSNIVNLYFDGTCERKRQRDGDDGDDDDEEDDDENRPSIVLTPTAKTMNKLLANDNIKTNNVLPVPMSVYSESPTDIPGLGELLHENKDSLRETSTSMATTTDLGRSNHWSLSSSKSGTTTVTATTTNTTTTTTAASGDDVQAIPGVTSDAKFWKAVSKAGGSLRRRQQTAKQQENKTSYIESENDYKSVSQAAPSSSSSNSYLESSYSSSEEEEGESTPQTVLFKVKVVHSYSAEMDDEISLKIGDVLDVVEFFDDGWAYGLFCGNDGGSSLEGAFPLACVIPFESDSDGRVSAMAESVKKRTSSLF